MVSTTPVRHSFAPAGTTIAIPFDQAMLPSSVDASSCRVFGTQTGMHRSGGGPCFGATFAPPFLRKDASQLIDEGE